MPIDTTELMKQVGKIKILTLHFTKLLDRTFLEEKKESGS